MILLRIILRFALAVTFLLSATGKLISLSEFVQVIHTYVSLPIVLLYCIAALICISELTLGVMILLGKKTVLASFGILVVTLAFTGIQVWAILRGPDGDCFCFGTLMSETIGWMTLARNTLVMFSAWILMHIDN